jgi:hypothetical protein
MPTWQMRSSSVCFQVYQYIGRLTEVRKSKILAPVLDDIANLIWHGDVDIVLHANHGHRSIDADRTNFHLSSAVYRLVRACIPLACAT